MGLISLSAFTWAGGIEDTFIPQSRPGLRSLDEYALTQHYQLWKQDFDLVAETGVKALRWGVPWYRVQTAPHRWDWSWIDRALEYLAVVKGITPILDLMHYGTPLWMDNSFINSNYPQYVAEYAAAVAERYQSLVTYYTPLNEPMVNAEYCGKKAEWPPYLAGDDGYVKLTLALCRGIIQTVNALRSVQPGSVIVQVEAMWHYWSKDAALQALILPNNLRQYLSLDLCLGKMNEQHLLYSWLCENGAQSAELEWFAQNSISYDFLGVNFYPWSYGEMSLGGNGKPKRTGPPTPGSAILEVIQSAWQRYHLPMMVTETSAFEKKKGTFAERSRWMDETIAGVAKSRQQGLPVVGYTWFPLLTMIDWEYRRGRKPLKEYLLHLGLYESGFDAAGVLQRQKTPLVEHYKSHQDAGMPEIGKKINP